MSYISPVNGNESFSKVSETRVNSQSVLDALNSTSTSPVSVIHGSIKPTVAGTYSIVDSAGHSLILPSGAVVDRVLYKGSGLVGGTDIVVSRAPDTTSTGTLLTAAVVTADALLGSAPASVVFVAIPASLYLNATTTGTFSSGQVNFTIYYL